MESRSLLLLLCTAACFSTLQGQFPNPLGNGTEIEDIRLVNGTYGEHMGRVEVMYNGTWGTICDDFWSFSDARVACRMLGYTTGLCAVTKSFFARDPPFGRGEGPIWMSNMRCRGNELSLDACSFNGWGIHSCTHAEDAGVICAADDLVGAPLNVAVVDSSTTTLTVQWDVPPRPAGIIAVRYRVIYRSDGDRFTRVRFLFPRFSQRNAPTLNTTLSFLRRNTNYTIQVRMEGRYSACFSYLPGNYSEPIIASTNATTRSTSLRIRLVPPSSGLEFMGRLEVFHSNQWGTVCDDRFGFTEANVVCNMLNYTRAVCSVSNARFGQGTGRIWMDDVDCSFQHEVLDQCRFRGWGVHNCRHSDDVGVVCRPDNYPGMVNNLTVTHVASTSVTLKWDAFSFPPSSRFSRYRISYRRPQDFFTRSTSVSSTITQTTIRFLQFGSSYNFSIRAEVRFSYCFSTLFGAYSDPVNATTMETEPTGPPTSFHVVVLNTTAIEVQWNLPLFQLRNGIIRGYRLFIQQQGEEQERTINIVGNDTTEYIISGLEPGTAYIVSALAYTVGDGPRSIHLTVSTPLINTNCLVGFGLNGDDLDRSVQYPWRRDLHIHCRAGTRNSEVDWFFANGTKVGTSDRNIREGHFQNGTTILQIASNRRVSLCDAGVYTCVANCSGLIETRNFTLIVNTFPPTPSRPVILRVGSSWVTFGWSEPLCDGGHRIVSFNIQYYEQTSSFFNRVLRYIRNIDPSARNYTISNLNPQTAYNFRVQSVSADFRTSSLSIIKSATTLPLGPSAPRNVTVRIIRPLLVEIRWRAPAVSNGQIIRYTVYAIPIAVFGPAISKRQAASNLPSGTIKQIFPASATAGNVTLTDDAVTYQFQMTASTFLGGGAENEGNLSIITPESTVFVPEQGLPTPQNLRVVHSTNSSVTLVWDLPPPPVEVITNFKVSYTASIEERSRGGTLIQFEESGEMNTPFARAVVSPLTPSTNYRFRVAAVTERGQGEEVIRYRRTDSAPSGERLAYLHIRIGPISDCIQWHDENAPQKISDIRTGLLTHLNSQCLCNLTTSHITNEELSCRQGLQNQISYRARIFGANTYSAAGLVQLLQAWVGTGTASIKVGLPRLEVDPSCPVILDNLLAPDCPPRTTQPTATTARTVSTTVSSETTGTTGTTPSTGTTPPTGTVPGVTADVVIGISGGELGGILVGVVIAVLLLALIVLLAIGILKYWNSKKVGRKTAEDKTPFAEISDGARHSIQDIEDIDTKENLGSDL